MILPWRLAQLLHDIRTFVAERPRQSISGLLIAKPGSGKTSLVRSLAKTVEMQFLDFNITQMVSKEDLIACFDTILTTQAQYKQQRVLVFFDEINALLHNQHVYDIFLSPLDDGIYLRSGKKYSLQPCIWIFASTTKPTESGALPHDESIKASDFQSRLTMEDIDLTPHGAAEEHEEHLEMVYRGVAMIQDIYPDVREVSPSVLDWLYNLNLKEVTPRILSRMIKAFENVQYGRISCQNIPEKFYSRSTPDNEWVRID